MTARFLGAIAIIAMVGATTGCSSRTSGNYANATNTSYLTLNADGTGKMEVRMRMFGEATGPYDTQTRFLYNIRGGRIKIDIFDDKTGRLYVPSSQVEVEMMRPLSEGTISGDRKTIKIVGDMFTRQ